MENELKKLSFEQMENLEGGSCGWGVAIAVGSIALGTAGLIMSGGTTAGLIVFGISRLFAVSSVVNSCVSNRELDQSKPRYLVE